MILAMLEPFSYEYMRHALLVSTLVGLLCGVLSCFLMLKGWSLIGDALSHAVVPGVVGAYLIGLPLAVGAFVSGALAAAIMRFIEDQTPLKADVIIGIVFTSFFGVALFVLSITPLPITVQTIAMGNVLALSPEDVWQITLTVIGCLLVLIVMWRSFLLVFFDTIQAHALGWSVRFYMIMFYALLSVAVVSALQTVGAFLVVAMVIIPGASMYLVIDRFGPLLLSAGLVGGLSCLCGTYLSFYLNGATGGIIILIQITVFLTALYVSQRDSGLGQGKTV